MSDQSTKITRAVAIGAGAVAAAGAAYLLYSRLSQAEGKGTAGEETATPSGTIATPSETEGADDAAPAPAAEPSGEKDEPMTKEERQAAWKKASKLYRDREYQAALDMFERVVRNTPSRNGAELKVMYYNIAACYDKLDRPKDVVRTSSAAIDIDPFYKKALHRRARALIALGGDENELQALGDLQVDFLHKVASSPHHAPDQAPEEYQESVKRVSRRRAAEAFPGILDKGTEMWSFPPRHGRRLMQTVWAAGTEPPAPSEEELSALEAAHREVTSAEGAPDVEAYVAALRNALRFDDALTVARGWYDKHEMAAPPGLLLQMGLLYHIRGAVREARLFLQRAAAQGHVLAQVHLAGIADEMGDFEDAQRLLEEAEQMDAASPHVFYHRGAILLSASRYEEACTALRRCLELAPTFAVARMQLSIGLFRLDKHEEAIDMLRRACDDAPDMPEVYTYLGEMYALLDEGERARESLRRAEELDGDCPLPFITRATLGIFPEGKAPATPQEMLEVASEMLESALARDPQNVQAYLRLAEVCGQKRDQEGARSAYEKARSYSRSVHDVADVEEALLNSAAVQRAMEHVREHAPNLAAFTQGAAQAQAQ